MPNTFAYFMLAIWPIISLVLFSRLSPLQATLWTICAGYMILPEGTSFDFPMIPALDKESMAALAALAGCYLIAKERIPLLPRRGIEKWLLIILLVCPLFTTVTNQEAFRDIPGMRLYDAASYIMGTYIGMIPFLLGLHLVKTYDDQLTVFKWMVIAGLIYSLPALYEVRMSPQLHRMFYGFFPHEWQQQIRFGGFRPVIFMRHGLVVSMFMSTALMATIALWKEKQGFFGRSRDTRKFTFFAVIYLFVTLILCKSVGSILYSTAFLIAAACLPIPISRLTAYFIIWVVITYPLSSLLGIFPHDELVTLAANINDLRAQSLGFRFMNEDILLTHAKEKLLFGWGLWGRNRPFSGVVTDGTWIILLGSVGLLGFLAKFGLPAIGVFRGLRAGKKLSINEGKKFIIYYALLVAIIMIDQLVNSSLSSWIWFLIGGLLGRSNYVLFRYAPLRNRKN